MDPDGRLLNRLVFDDWELSDLMSFRIICQPAVFMRRSFLDQAGYLDLNLHYMLDHQLWLRLARIAPIRHTPTFLAAARHHPGAKNVSQASGFGRETLELLAWMKKDPLFSTLVKQKRRGIEGGAYRLNARYLLDGGEPGAALKWYGKSFLASPRYAFKHWHRMLYALSCQVGLKRIGDAYLRRHEQARENGSILPQWPDIPGMEGWPGLVT
jgi:hypothetical protein